MWPGLQAASEKRKKYTYFPQKDMIQKHGYMDFLHRINLRKRTCDENMRTSRGDMDLCDIICWNRLFILHIKFYSRKKKFIYLFKFSLVLESGGVPSRVDSFSHFLPLSIFPFILTTKQSISPPSILLNQHLDFMLGEIFSSLFSLPHLKNEWAASKILYWN